MNSIPTHKHPLRCINSSSLLWSRFNLKLRWWGKVKVGGNRWWWSWGSSNVASSQTIGSVYINIYKMRKCPWDKDGHPSYSYPASVRGIRNSHLSEAYLQKAKKARRDLKATGPESPVFPNPRQKNITREKRASLTQQIWNHCAAQWAALTHPTQTAHRPDTGCRKRGRWRLKLRWWRNTLTGKKKKWM